jgi:hypothetical protein
MERYFPLVVSGDAMLSSIGCAWRELFYSRRWSRNGGVTGK